MQGISTDKQLRPSLILRILAIDDISAVPTEATGFNRIPKELQIRVPVQTFIETPLQAGAALSMATIISVFSLDNFFRLI